MVSLFPIWSWFPIILMYLVFFPCSVNIGDLSFSCALSSPLGNLTYFHSFNYCNFQNHISYILVISPPILWNFWHLAHSSSPPQARLSFWVIQYPGGSTLASHIFQDLCHPISDIHPHGRSMELIINWKYSTVRMTNSSILCSDKASLFPVSSWTIFSLQFFKSHGRSPVLWPFIFLFNQHFNFLSYTL